MRTVLVTALMAWLAVSSLSCSGASTPAGERLEITIAPLGLVDVDDVAWTIEVRTAQDALVWRRERLRASDFGDGQGLAYVGPCDATPSANPNRVTLVLEDLYGPSAVIDPASYKNPTKPIALVREVVCAPDADVAVPFDVTLLRAADQGFFDVAVSFADVFCSAKLDCVDQGANNPLMLLHDPTSGERAPSAVLAFACTAGPDADTYLYLDEVLLTCGGTSVPLDIDGPGGNVYSLAHPAPPPLVQVATYRGLAEGGVIYFNVALAAKLSAATSDCTLSTRGTASSTPLPGFTTAPNAVYPLVHWSADLIDAETDAFVCGKRALDDPNAPADSGVFTSYALTPQTFAYEIARDPSDPTRVVIEARDATPSGVITGRVVEDIGGDGVDAGDLGIAGVNVTLTRNGATVSVVTGASGAFAQSLPVGDYVVAVGPQAALATRPEATTLTSRTVTVTAGGTATASFGFRGAATLRGVVFVDADGDGARGAGEVVLSGVAVNALADGGASGTTVTSGASGFSLAVLPGRWSVRAVVPDAYDLPLAWPAFTDLAAGAVRDVDIALVPLSSVEVTVFEDTDGDGAVDVGEAMVMGREVVLRAGTVVDSEVTSASGVVVLTSRRGDLEVFVDPNASGFAADFSGVTTTNPRPVSLAPFAASAVAVGLRPLGRVEGFVYADTDQDGHYDIGELGLEGVTVGFGGLTFVTDGDGRYVAKLGAGAWISTVDLGQDALAGYVSTSGDGTHTVTDGTAQVHDFGLVEAGEVTGFAFFDVEQDLFYDGDEPVIADVIVVLTGAAIHTTSTDALGHFRFVVPPGEYVLDIDAQLSPLALPLPLTLAPGEWIQLDLAMED